MGSTSKSLRPDASDKGRSKTKQKFQITFIDNYEAFNDKCNWEANITSNCIRRRSKDEVERGTHITTLNVSISLQYFEWILENTEDHIVLIQEHWRLP
eukprot:11741759-Heterocapsa_arctica.AAC.1